MGTIKTTHPVQPIVLDDRGIARFKENKIVSYLLDLASQRGICDMNTLAQLPFSAEDRNQFAQLIGYSVGGFADLSYSNEKIVAEADAAVAKLFEAQKARKAAKKMTAMAKKP